ncbi:MAG: hypothetical protein U9O98_03470, partial [Asgard group archaeon]|nr:hypothetical protein [Asgard group archaeon]
TAGFEIIDFSNSENIYQVNSVSYSRSFRGLAKRNNYLFVCGGGNNPQEGFFKIYNLTNPLSITLTSSIQIPNALYIKDVKLLGNYAYLSCGFDGLTIINITDFSSTSITDNYLTGSSNYYLGVTTDYVYLRNSSGIEILDTSNKSDITPLNVFGSSWAYDFAINNDELYVTKRKNGVIIYDITNRTDPTELTSFNIKANDYHLYFYNNKLAVTSEYYGLRLFDVSTPANPVLQDHFSGGGYAYEPVKNGDLIYLANGAQGLEIIDTSTKTNPILMNSTGYVNGSNFIGVGFDNDKLVTTYGEYVLTYFAMNVYNISKPTNIDKSGGTPQGSYPSLIKAKVRGNYAYVGSKYDGFNIYNITDPTNPTKITDIFYSDYISDVMLKGDYAYLADRSYGLRIVDISDVSNPLSIGNYSIGELFMYRYEVFVDENDIVYLTNQHDEKVYVINATTKSNPTLIAQDTFTSVKSCYVEADFLFMARGDEGLEIFDISDFQNVESVGSYRLTSGSFEEMIVENGTIYAATGKGGLVILKFDTDGDGITDPVERKYYSTDPTLADTDDDGLTDPQEIFTHYTDPINNDTDGDMLLDGDEIDQETDPFDPDSDDDGLTDGEELLIHATDPLDPDCDDDGLLDGEEINHSPQLDPFDSDTDNDGLDDYEEIYDYGTNPAIADTDGDGLDDGEELIEGDDGYITDPTNPDTDGDTWSDGEEYNYGTDPLDPTDHPTDTSTTPTTPTSPSSPPETGNGALIGGLFGVLCLSSSIFLIGWIIKKRKST